MNAHLKLILSTFTVQKSRNDCGLACLRCIFQYAGVTTNIETTSDAPLSLLTLKHLAIGAGLDAECVKMDIAAVTRITSPCILFVVNDDEEPHFVVHYPACLGESRHLIGDPSRKVELVSRDWLLSHWKNGAALYIDDLKPVDKFRYRLFPWLLFSQFKLLPCRFLLSIPFLNVVAILLGLSISVIVQRAAAPGFLNETNDFFALLYVLAFLLTGAKLALTFFTQRLLSTFSVSLDNQLSKRFAARAFSLFRNSGKGPFQFCMIAIAEKQKAQQGAAALVSSVLSDVVMLLTIYGTMWLFQPGAVVFSLLSFIAILFLTDYFTPLILIQPDQWAPGNPRNERLTENEIFSNFDGFAGCYNKMNRELIFKSQQISRLTIKIASWFEAISWGNLFLVLLYAIEKMRHQQASYEEFLTMILLSYSATVMLTKICKQLFVLAQSAQKLKENCSEEPE